MSKVMKLEPKVKEVLEKYEVARNSDDLLLLLVYQHINKDVCTLDYREVMMNRKELGLPSAESVTRCRRKLQADNEHLRADKEVSEQRYNNQKEFIEYALDKAMV